MDAPLLKFKLANRYNDNGVMKYPGEFIECSQTDANDLHALGWGDVVANVEEKPAPKPEETADVVRKPMPDYNDREMVVSNAPKKSELMDSTPGRRYSGRRDMRATKP